jgi:DNA mismatch repair ATPase MutS
MRHSLFSLSTGGVIMMYFSLLYEESQQEHLAKKHSIEQLYIYKNLESLKKFKMVGNKMVPVASSTAEDRKKVPAFFHDLNIDQMIDDILSKDRDHKSEVIFYDLLPSKETIAYRQEIFRDIDNQSIDNEIQSFNNSMNHVFRLMEYVKQSNHPIQRCKYILDAISLYQINLTNLLKGLEGKVKSSGLNKLLRLLKEYMDSEYYVKLKEKTSYYKSKIEGIHYSLTITSSNVLLNYEQQSENYNDTFRKLFDQQYDSDNEISFLRQVTLTELELRIADILYEKEKAFFLDCIQYTNGNDCFIDELIVKMHNDLKFYISCHDYFSSIKAKGFPITYPDVSDIYTFEMKGIYDINMANQSERISDVVANDFMLEGGKAGAWISGANQGGKTTFARSIGQIAYLSLIGFPVPAAYAKIPLFCGIFTHFSSEENTLTSNGKLKEELLHMKQLIKYARNGNNLFLLNEPFSSTSAFDAYEMCEHLVNRLIEMNSTVICVTHIPKLARECSRMISLGTVLEDNADHTRTYKIIPKEAESTAYAYDIAKQYQLTFEQIMERLGYEI